MALKLMPKNNQTMLTIFIVITQERTFPLARTVEFNLCGYIMTETEHPKRFLLETQRGQTFKAK
jgi:hypothetical protein